MTYPVPDSSELRRIAALPTRDWVDGQLLALAEQWSPMLLNPQGLEVWNRAANMTPEAREQALEHYEIRLADIQAQILYEAVQVGGAFVDASVGAGKTLVSWLAPLVLGAQRPVLMISAGARNSTHDKFAKIAQYWRAPAPIQFLTYHDLSRLVHKHALCSCVKCTGSPELSAALDPGLRPDLIVLDESDLTRRSSSAVSKRVDWYMSRHPETKVITLTGTSIRKSLRDINRQLIWTHKHNAPIPIQWSALEPWCEALDVSKRTAPRSPGALTCFADQFGVDQMDDETKRARIGYGRRLAATPGVVIYNKASTDAPLTIRLIQAPPDPILDQAFADFRRTDETPDGMPISDPLSALRLGTELGCGFYSRWDPRPPRPWREARRAWAALVRDSIRDSARTRTPIESEAEAAIRHRDSAIYQTWREIEPTFKPNSVAVPVSMSVLAYAAQWLQANSPAIVWVQHTWVGETLSRITGLPYFGAKGLSANGAQLLKYDTRRSCIVSAHANRRERNLQGYSRNLIVGPEHSAERNEQMIGRTHRRKQRAHVYVDVLISCAENLQAIEAACTESHNVDDLTRANKLLTATWDWSHFPAEQLKALPNDAPSKCRWTPRR